MEPGPVPELVAASTFAHVLSVQIGMDIGQKHDPTAIVVAEVRERPVPLPIARETHYRIQRLERLDLGTAYPLVVAHLVKLLRALHDREVALRAKEYAARTNRLDIRATRLPVDIFIDATGVGTPVVDMVAEALRAQPASERASVHALWFNHGDRYDTSTGMLGKGYLVSRLQVLLQQRLMELPNASPDAEQMLRELQDYEIRVNEHANELYGAFAVGTHDDLVTALGLACLEDPLMNRVEVGPRIW